MALDLATERTLRKALFASIDQDFDSFENQLQAFEGNDAVVAACARATDLTALMIVEKSQGRPSQETLQKLADSTAEHSGWSQIASESFATYLTAVFEGRPVDRALDLGTALRVPFLQCAHLLLIWHEPGEQWHEYLDRLWDTLEEGDPQLT